MDTISIFFEGGVRMINFTRNGFLVQDINKPTNHVKTFNYLGMDSYISFPLSFIANAECRDLTKKHEIYEFPDNTYRYLEYISSDDLLLEYLECCKKYNIETRVLMVESNYTEEKYLNTLSCATFIGYEYCPIPIDNQVITDLDWCSLLQEFKKGLNSYGLFSNYVDIYEFHEAYTNYCKIGSLGDGLDYAYICKVYEVDVIKYMEVHKKANSENNQGTVSVKT